MCSISTTGLCLNNIWAAWKRGDYRTINREKQSTGILGLLRISLKESEDSLLPIRYRICILSYIFDDCLVQERSVGLHHGLEGYSEKYQVMNTYITTKSIYFIVYFWWLLGAGEVGGPASRAGGLWWQLATSDVLYPHSLRARRGMWRLCVNSSQYFADSADSKYSQTNFILLLKTGTTA